MIEADFSQRIYADYYEKVLHYISGKVQNRPDAEDLTNDVFVKVLEKIDLFDDSKASISTWIYTIAKNTVIDHYRKQRTFCELDETLIAGNETDANNLHEQMLDDLANALEVLDSRTRNIIILHYFSGLTLKTIAEKLDLSYSYTKLLHKTGLSALKRRLQL